MVSSPNKESSQKNVFPDSVFIGRKSALAKLKKEFENTLNGQGNFIIINGEAGSGKSALLDHFLSSANEQDAQVASIRFEQGLEFAPYSPFIRLMQDLEKIQNTRSGENINSTSQQNSSITLNDDAKDDFGIQQMQVIQSKQSQIQQQILYNLVEHATDKPLVISLDNTHFASLSAWQFFHYLADKCREHPVLFISTLRQDGQVFGDNKQPLYADILQRMNRDGFVQKITLDRLSEDDLRQLLLGLFQKTDFSGNFISFLLEVSNGIPGQIMKYLKILYDTQILYIKNGVWFNLDDLDKEKLIKAGLNQENIESIEQEMNQFTSTQQELLNYASLFKYPFDYRLFVALSNIPKLTVLKELKRFEDKKYFIPNAENTFNFKNAEIKSILAERISQSDRERMHLALANQIAVLDFFSSIEKKYLLAYHYSQSSEKCKAYPYLIEAADIALQNFAFLEARDLYQQAITLERTEPVEAQKKQRIHVLMQAAWLNRVLGFYEESIQNSETALEVHGQTAKDRLANLIRMQQGFTYFRLNNWQAAEANFKMSLEHIDILQTFEKSMVMYGLGNINFELGNYQDAQDNYNHALDFAKESQDKSHIALLLNNLGVIENVTGNTMKAIALYSQAIPLYKETEDNSGLAKIYNNIGMTYSDENNWDQANQFYGKSLSVTGVMGLAPLKSITFLNRALALAHLNQLKEAREYSFKAIRLLERLNDALGIAEFHKIQGVIETKDQNWDSSEQHFIKAMELFQKYDNNLGYAESLLERGISDLAHNRNQEALNWLSQANEIFTEMKVVKKAEIAQSHINKISRSELVE